ncbi:MAG: 2-C-methyl-D-erythritol 4-phosphate cytidylyltransferase [Blastocatellales bacterium]|nr:2-C-methyl-D-erythritol 4-phosphate cytidylyltransferase [Blastocatellales bacterium]
MNVAIIPAAGSGVRLGGSIPKQFIELSGAPILIHTLLRFDLCPDIDALVVALTPDRISSFPDEACSRGIRKPLIVAEGGGERSESIRRALDAAARLQPNIVAVHDAVRPFVTTAQISAVIRRASDVGAAILALPATDTIKQVEDGYIRQTLDRRRIYRAQTPQAFRFELLRRANDEMIARALSPETFTDDAMLVEYLGERVAVVEGSARNIKITTRDDLALAEHLFASFASIDAEDKGNGEL